MDQVDAPGMLPPSLPPKEERTSIVRLFSGLALLLIIAALPITLLLTKQSSDNRQHASGVQTTCGIHSLDAVLVLDNSGSMTGEKLKKAKAAAKSFIDIISEDTNTRVGLAYFSTKATLASPLVKDYAGVKGLIDAIPVGGNTCIQCGAITAESIFQSAPDSANKKVYILLTDGIANTITTGTASQTTAEQKTTEAVTQAFAQNHAALYTIGLGSDVHSNFLVNLASITGGAFYFSPPPYELNTIYQDISQIAGKGSIEGTIFNDANNDGIRDTTETPLKDITVTLMTADGTQAVATTSSNSYGVYKFTKLCDSSYRVVASAPDGKSQTVPTEPDYYDITIQAGNTVGNKDFGFVARVCGIACSSDASCGGTDNGCTACIENKCQNPSSFLPKVKIIDPQNGATISGVTQIPVEATASASAGTIKKVEFFFDQNDNPFASSSASPYKVTANAPFDTKDCNAHDVMIRAQATDSYGNVATDSASVSWTAPCPISELLFPVALHGIGNGGDNVNPASIGNLNPIHSERSLSIVLFDLNNTLVASYGATILYASDSGLFNADIMLDSRVTPGKYVIKAQSPEYLRSVFNPTIVDLKAGVNQLPKIALVSGDIIPDNRLDLLDYNQIYGCYSVDQPARSCTPDQKLAADISDDGNVNGDDYNLFLRELSVQRGDGGDTTPIPSVSPTPMPTDLTPTPTLSTSLTPTPTSSSSTTPSLTPVPTFDPNLLDDEFDFTGTAFDPASIPDAIIGDDVGFVNLSSQTIRIVSDAGSPEAIDTGDIAPNMTWHRIINTLGTYTFHLQSNPAVTGSFTVLQQ